MTSRADKAANLETAERLVLDAVGRVADVVVLPEKWNAIGTAEQLSILLRGQDDELLLASLGERHRFDQCGLEDLARGSVHVRIRKLLHRHLQSIA